MSLISKQGAEQLRSEVKKQKYLERGEELTQAFAQQWEVLHSQDIPMDQGIEQLILHSKQKEQKKLFRKGVYFSPSSASKCERELYYRGIHAKKDDQTMYPYQRRWTRNARAVHEAVQRDLLYAEKYVSPVAFKVGRTLSGIPAWEDAIFKTREFAHNEVSFSIRGMMDGILFYKDGTNIGFEFKTKSTTIAQVGDYLMRDVMEYHRTQVIAYSLLFEIDEFIVMYESLAKDSWMKGEEAKNDIRFFYVKVEEEEEERKRLLDKFARVAKQIQDQQLPERDLSKCLFCSYKTVCEIDGDVH